jgi:hypothetical protein
LTGYLDIASFGEAIQFSEKSSMALDRFVAWLLAMTTVSRRVPR